MGSYVGLDVADKQTAICVIDDAVEKRWEGKVRTAPELIAATVRERAPDAVRIGLETGPLCVWLWHTLNEAGLPIIALHARQTSAALSLQANKTDRNDAAGLARIVRSGWYKAVAVKSLDAHKLRALLATRDQLVGMSTSLVNKIRSTLKTFGVLLGSGRGSAFETKVREAMPDDPIVRTLIESLLRLWRTVREQRQAIDSRLMAFARHDPVCRLLTTAPGVGAITAISFTTTIGDPRRFGRSADVGAYLGLTPKQYQSGDVKVIGRISRCGDTLTRKLLFEAATVVIARLKRPLSIKTWGEQIARRAGVHKARVAVARKLATVLHQMWLKGEPFRLDLPAA